METLFDLRFLETVWRSRPNRETDTIFTLHHSDRAATAEKRGDRPYCLFRSFASMCRLSKKWKYAPFHETLIHIPLTWLTSPSLSLLLQLRLLVSAVCVRRSACTQSHTKQIKNNNIHVCMLISIWFCYFFPFVSSRCAHCFCFFRFFVRLFLCICCLFLQFLLFQIDSF